MSKTEEKGKMSGVKYGIFMEKLCTKLRRLSLAGAFQHKKDVASLLNSTLETQKTIKEDKDIDEATKNNILMRMDTLAWFMGSILEEIHDIEVLNKPIEEELKKQVEEDLDYLG